MHIFLVYGSIEGQTRKIARHIEEHLNSNHHSCILIDASDDEAKVDLTDVSSSFVMEEIKDTTELPLSYL